MGRNMVYNDVKKKHVIASPARGVAIPCVFGHVKRSARHYEERSDVAIPCVSDT